MKLIDFIHKILVKKEFERFIAKRKPAVMPRLDKPIAITFILEDTDKQTISDIRAISRNIFGHVQNKFIIINKMQTDTCLQTDSFLEVTPKDFNFLKLPKSETRDNLDKITASHVLVNMARNNPDVSDYLSILVKALFRCCFESGSNDNIYDLLINTAQNSSPITNTKILHDYLEALTGTKTPTNNSNA